MPRFGRVVLGGTFDRLHLGHEALLATAFRIGRSVAIGLTTERYLALHPKPAGIPIQSYSTRRATLRRWLSARYPVTRWTVTPLNDIFGGSVGDGVDALVVSADTQAGGRAVNAERRRLGRRRVPVIVVPLTLADDLRPLSSRRIRAGEIDRAGRRRSPIEVGLAVESPEDRGPATDAIRRALPRARVRPVPFLLRVPVTAEGLRARAGSAAGGAGLGVVVALDSRHRRRVALGSPAMTLGPRTVVARSPEELAGSLARLVAPSTQAKGFSFHRK